MRVERGVRACADSRTLARRHGEGVLRPLRRLVLVVCASGGDACARTGPRRGGSAGSGRGGDKPRQTAGMARRALDEVQVREVDAVRARVMRAMGEPKRPQLLAVETLHQVLGNRGPLESLVQPGHRPGVGVHEANDPPDVVRDQGCRPPRCRRHAVAQRSAARESVKIADLQDRCLHPRVRADGWSPPYARGLALLGDQLRSSARPRQRGRRVSNPGPAIRRVPPRSPAMRTSRGMLAEMDRRAELHPVGGAEHVVILRPVGGP